MAEGKWHEEVRKKLLAKYGNRAVSSHDTSSIQIFVGRISKKNFISSPDIIVFEDKSKKIIEKIIEIEDSANPKTLLADVFITRTANTYKANGRKHRLKKNFPITVIYNDEKDKLKRIKKLEKEIKKRWKELNFNFQAWNE